MSTITINHMKLYNNQVKMNSKTLMSSSSEAKIQTKRKPRISLVIGGINSGKTSYVLNYLLGFGNSASERAIITTSEERVNEVKKNCVSMKLDPDNSFLIINEEKYISENISNIPKSAQIVAIDNISSWIADICKAKEDFSLLETEVENLIKTSHTDLIIISNIVGMGIIPDNETDEQFREKSGDFNKKIANLADNVILMIAGIPMKVKGELL